MAASYTFSDLSGLSKSDKEFTNPFDVLLDQCRSSIDIQQAYHRHRTTRNGQQKAKLLAEEFPGVTVDAILSKLENPESFPGFVDPRSCLVFWARPTSAVQDLCAEIQRRLKDVVPGLWTMPRDNLHMTAMEVAHSLTPDGVEQLVKKLEGQAKDITDTTSKQETRLVKPLVSFDAQAVALSFLPAAGEPGRSAEDDEVTYHHLRRDLHSKVEASLGFVGSRYVVPSAHLTLARFVRTSDFEDGDGKLDSAKVKQLVSRIDDINAWLQENFWPGGESYDKGGQWLVGQERGTTYRKGLLWYGGGETIYQGRHY